MDIYRAVCYHVTKRKLYEKYFVHLILLTKRRLVATRPRPLGQLLAVLITDAWVPAVFVAVSHWRTFTRFVQLGCRLPWPPTCISVPTWGFVLMGQGLGWSSDMYAYFISKSIVKLSL